jgi:hypothetical protein
MRSATVHCGNGITASLTDVGTAFKLLIRIPIVGQPNMSQCLDLTAKKEDVREFMDVLMEAEDVEDGEAAEGTNVAPAGTAPTQSGW